MIALLLAAALMQDPPAASEQPQPEAWVGYYEATACAAAALVASETLPEAEQEAAGREVFAWSVAAAHLGPSAGRMPEQIDGFDGGRAVAFFRRLARDTPDAFAARRAYCQALTPDADAAAPEPGR
jgi:hypothetical protein